MGRGGHSRPVLVVGIGDHSSPALVVGRGGCCREVTLSRGSTVPPGRERYLRVDPYYFRLGKPIRVLSLIFESELIYSHGYSGSTQN